MNIGDGIMLSEEIIIDCVDVAGCAFYIPHDGSCSSHDTECVKCIHNDCYYKQLQRLEQENKELKENLLDKYSPRYYEIVPHRRIVEMQKKFANLRDRMDKYRKSLEEIRDLIISSELPAPTEETLIDANMLNEVVRENRENKLHEVLKMAYEFLNK